MGSLSGWSLLLSALEKGRVIRGRLVKRAPLTPHASVFVLEEGANLRKGEPQGRQYKAFEAGWLSCYSDFELLRRFPVRIWDLG